MEQILLVLSWELQGNSLFSSFSVFILLIVLVTIFEFSCISSNKGLSSNSVLFDLAFNEDIMNAHILVYFLDLVNYSWKSGEQSCSPIILKQK